MLTSSFSKLQCVCCRTRPRTAGEHVNVSSADSNEHCSHCFACSWPGLIRKHGKMRVRARGSASSGMVGPFFFTINSGRAQD